MGGRRVHLTNGLRLMYMLMSLALLSVVTSHVGAQTNQSQTELQAGTWKTWVLTAGSQLRLPAPPDQAATATEIREMKTLL